MTARSRRGGSSPVRCTTCCRRSDSVLPPHPNPCRREKQRSRCMWESMPTNSSVGGDRGPAIPAGGSPATDVSIASGGWGPTSDEEPRVSRGGQSTKASSRPGGGHPRFREGGSGAPAGGPLVRASSGPGGGSP